MLKRNFEPQRPHAYARYARVSDEKQNVRSPDQQFDSVERTRKRLGRDNWVHLRDERDDAISGRYVYKRPGFSRLLRDIYSGSLPVDLILVDTFERLGRADEISVIRHELWTKYSVLVLTANTDFADPTTVPGQMMAAFEGIRATDDNAVKAHNVLRGMLDSARQGHWPGGRVPFGYRLLNVLTERGGRTEVDYSLLAPDPETEYIVTRCFTLARDTGWAKYRLSRALNEDPEIPKRYKPFLPDRVAYWLNNEIYRGTLVWNRFCTGVVNDTVVKQRNEGGDEVRIENFCKPLTDQATWDAIQAVRQGRHAARARALGPPVPGKEIAVLAPGARVTRLLSGLIRCTSCGSSMAARSSRPKGKSNRTYVYYECTRSRIRACENRRSLNEVWLIEVVVAQLRERLFPPPAQGGQVPLWFPGFEAQVRREVEALSRQDVDRGPALCREREALEGKVDGWLLTLANVELNSVLRQKLEALSEESLARAQAIDTELAGLKGVRSVAAQGLSPQVLLDSLHRLAEVLHGGNVAVGNLELAKHIDRIDCHADGRLEMVSTPLGAFGGLVELLRSTADLTPLPPTGTGETYRVQARSRGRTRITSAPGEARPGSGADLQEIEPNRYAGLDDRWFWRDPLVRTEKVTWGQANATRVVAKQDETGWGVLRLAKHFGVSRYKIKSALKLMAPGTETEGTG